MAIKATVGAISSLGDFFAFTLLVLFGLHLSSLFVTQNINEVTPELAMPELEDLRADISEAGQKLRKAKQVCAVLYLSADERIINASFEFGLLAPPHPV